MADEMRFLISHTDIRHSKDWCSTLKDAFKRVIEIGPPEEGQTLILEVTRAREVTGIEVIHHVQPLGEL